MSFRILSTSSFLNESLLSLFPLSMTREQRTAVFQYWLSAVEVGVFWSALTRYFGTCVYTVNFHFELTCCCLSCHQNLLGGYPPNHVLSALEYLASREQKELEEKLTSLDVTRDVTALRYSKRQHYSHIFLWDYKSVKVFIWHFNCRFRYESNHLLDMSAEEDNELPPVKTLLEVLNTNTRWYNIQEVPSRRKHVHVIPGICD